MKEIETLVEEKTKESLDVSRLMREGESAALGVCGCPGGSEAGRPRPRPREAPWQHQAVGQPQGPSRHGSGPNLPSLSPLTHPWDFHLEGALRTGFC